MASGSSKPKEWLAFGRRIKELRVARGLSQSYLAERVGLDNSYISKMEHGRCAPPTTDRVFALAQRLGADPKELVRLAGRLVAQAESAGARAGASKTRAATDDEIDVIAAHLFADELEAAAIFARTVAELRAKGVERKAIIKAIKRVIAEEEAKLRPDDGMGDEELIDTYLKGDK
jgi:transcriptional regulator with XRE-family HTH domain